MKDAPVDDEVVPELPEPNRPVITGKRKPRIKASDKPQLHHISIKLPDGDKARLQKYVDDNSLGTLSRVMRGLYLSIIPAMSGFEELPVVECPKPKELKDDAIGVAVGVIIHTDLDTCAPVPHAERKNQKDARFLWTFGKIRGCIRRLVDNHEAEDDEVKAYHLSRLKVYLSWADYFYWSDTGDDSRPPAVVKSGRYTPWELTAEEKEAAGIPKFRPKFRSIPAEFLRLMNDAVADVQPVREKKPAKDPTPKPTPKTPPTPPPKDDEDEVTGPPFPLEIGVEGLCRDGTKFRILLVNGEAVAGHPVLVRLDRGVGTKEWDVWYDLNGRHHNKAESALDLHQRESSFYWDRLWMMLSVWSRYMACDVSAKGRHVWRAYRSMPEFKDNRWVTADAEAPTEIPAHLAPPVPLSYRLSLRERPAFVVPMGDDAPTPKTDESPK